MPRLCCGNSLRQLQLPEWPDQALATREEGGPRPRCLLRLYLLLWGTFPPEEPGQWDPEPSCPWGRL